MIDEQKLRHLCRTEFGGHESRAFQEALDASPAAGPNDPVPVTLGLDFDKREMFLPREEVEVYAKIAAEERKPEDDFLHFIKPQMRQWILINRKGMCEKLRAALKDYSPEHNSGVTIVWPNQTPDLVPEPQVRAYLWAYE